MTQRRKHQCRYREMLESDDELRELGYVKLEGVDVDALRFYAKSYATLLERGYRFGPDDIPEELYQLAKAVVDALGEGDTDE